MNIAPASQRTPSFRLTREALRLLARMARKVGRPRGGLLEGLIRERAKHERLDDHDSPDVPRC
jgi:hypothetical protein